MFSLFYPSCSENLIDEAPKRCKQCGCITIVIRLNDLIPVEMVKRVCPKSARRRVRIIESSDTFIIGSVKRQGIIKAMGPHLCYGNLFDPKSDVILTFVVEEKRLSIEFEQSIQAMVALSVHPRANVITN